MNSTTEQMDDTGSKAYLHWINDNPEFDQSISMYGCNCTLELNGKVEQVYMYFSNPLVLMEYLEHFSKSIDPIELDGSGFGTEEQEEEQT